MSPYDSGTHALNSEPRKLVPDEQGNLWEESPEIENTISKREGKEETAANSPLL